MQILKGEVVINLSPAQRKLLREPELVSVVANMTVGPDSGSRPRIPVANILKIVEQLEHLKSELSNSPRYARRRPAQVITQIILKLTGARDAHKRAYPS